MAAGGQGSTAKDRSAETAQRLKVVLGILIMMAVAGAFTYGALLTEDDGTAVPPPTSTERSDTVTLLQRAHTAQQVCYGWILRRSGSWATPVSVGSNLGDNVAVDSDPTRCPRWVEITASVDYTSESSESSDSATYQVNASAELAGIDFAGGLDRLGVDSNQFVDDPGWAVCRAAVFLPLLVSEAGAAPASGVPTPSAAGQPDPLPDPGSDFWRDRWVFLAGAGGIFLFTALLLSIGWFERRHQLRAAAGRGR